MCFKYKCNLDTLTPSIQMLTIEIYIGEKWVNLLMKLKTVVTKK